MNESMNTEALANKLDQKLTKAFGREDGQHEWKLGGQAEFPMSRSELGGCEEIRKALVSSQRSV